MGKYIFSEIRISFTFFSNNKSDNTKRPQKLNFPKIQNSLEKNIRHRYMYFDVLCGQFPFFLPGNIEYYCSRNILMDEKGPRPRQGCDPVGFVLL